jgi:uncharacterized protein YqiB (DUF1249 family)
MEINGEHITQVKKIRDLAYMVDSCLKNYANVNKFVSSSYLALKDISSIRHKLDDNTTKLLINSLVTSWLDYCNSLLVGTTQHNM